MNPLTQYFRHPELHLQLPSQGRFWPKDSIYMPPNNEIGVASMTGADDLTLRNADGLMNGDATVKVIQSCCSNIKNAWDMPIIDSDALLIAIRIASYGHQMDMTTKCSKCGHEIDYAVDLRYVLGNIKYANYDDPVVVNDLTVFIRPASYKIVNLINQDIYQQQRAILALKDERLTQDQKNTIVREAFARLSEITVSRMHEYIEKIVLPNGEVVTEPKFIKEFIENANRQTFDIINQAIKSKNEEYKLPKVPIKCDNCGHADERDLQFDPSSFFV